jgi:anthranilate phosphoribosyltransferase
MGLRLRGETIDEIIGAAEAMRAAMTPVEAPAGAIDIVGTGGDGAGTYNISTLAAIIAAAAGAIVAKHGGKAASSLSGSSDVLGELGVKVGVSPDAAAASLQEAGICFMAATTHHPAMRHAAPVRSELGVRTIFNLLGPLCNPARVERQMIGVFSRDWLEPLARVLRELGAKRVVALEDGEIRSFDLSPEDAGLPRATIQALVGGDAAHNARALRAVLEGAKNAYRDVAVLNAGVALVVAGRAANVREGAALAEAAIDSGAARNKLDALIRCSHRDA